MYQQHRAFVPPKNPLQEIWRYQDLSKFLRMLQTQSLYFSRGDQLGDPFEGSISESTKIVRVLFPSSEKVDSSDLTRGLLAARSQTYINCWHMNSTESAAMWTVYGRDSNAIAIQSTFKSLTESFRTLADIYVGAVDYVNYDDTIIPEGNHFFPFLHKRESFQHEAELRAIIWLTEEQSKHLSINFGEYPTGLSIPVDLSTLIETIYISPLSPKWFAEVVNKLIADLSIHKPVIYSRLADQPVF